MMNLKESIESTADGAFAVDMNLKIVHWNQAAQDILGFDASETIGHPCYEVLQGLDEDDRLICTTYCQVAKFVSRREPVASHDVLALTKKGERRWLNMSIVTYAEENEERGAFILHLFRDSNKQKDVEAFLKKVLAVVRHHNDRPQAVRPAREIEPRIGELTNRERQVLSYLTKGYGTREIAQTLFISPNTVRNHIQHVLQKLHAHRRVEAVACAIRLGIVE